MTSIVTTTLRAGALLGVALLTTACWEAPPIETKQIGFRGTAMEQNVNPRIAAQVAARNRPPEFDPPADVTGQRASQVYQNVQVLGDLSETEFLRIMAHMTQSVAPEAEGCAYCHNVENMADGSKYQYTVARRMLQMTRAINSTWSNHVGQTGVTCWTCHRGNSIPQYTWFTQPPSATEGPGGGFIGNRFGQNQPALLSVGRASLPAEPFTATLLGNELIRMTGNQVMRNPQSTVSIQDTERTNALMNHMSVALGVNCTYCHNSRAFNVWDQSPPQRATAFHGIQMTRAINNTYLAPLNTTYPAARLGATGDAAKAYCTTCHQGQNKPMAGAPMLRNYPELGAPRPAPRAEIPVLRGGG